MIESSKYLADWREQIRQASATYLFQLAPIETAVGLTLTFYMPRPKSHFDSKGELKASAALAKPTGRPDLSKLVRAVEDAITNSKLWRDDSLVTACHAWKHYAPPGKPTGVSISILPI
jgi:crossover junction endodeoxyribonuclease RusA